MCNKTYFVYVTWFVLLPKFQRTGMELTELQILLEGLLTCCMEDVQRCYSVV